jgi:hypothetical protein
MTWAESSHRETSGLVRHAVGWGTSQAPRVSLAAHLPRTKLATAAPCECSPRTILILSKFDAVASISSLASLISSILTTGPQRVLPDARGGGEGTSVVACRCGGAAWRCSAVRTLAGTTAGPRPRSSPPVSATSGRLTQAHRRQGHCGLRGEDRRTRPRRRPRHNRIRRSRRAWRHRLHGP